MAAKKAETAVKVEEVKAPVEKKAAAPKAEKKVAAPKAEKKAAAPKAEKAVAPKAEKVAAPKAEKKAAAPKAAKKAAAKASESVVIEFQGGQINVADIVAAVKAVAPKAKELKVYYQPENGVAYYTADGVEGSVNL